MIRTKNEYSDIGGDHRDGVLYDALTNIKDDYQKHENKEWPKHLSLNFDACHIIENNLLNM